MTAIEAVVLDLDETLTDENSLTGTLRELGGSLAGLAELGACHRAGTLGRQEVLDGFLALLTEKGPVTRARLEAVFAGFTVRKDSKLLVRQIIESGRPAALISSSFDLYVASMAKQLGVGQHYSNIALQFSPTDTLMSVDFDLDTASRKHQQLHDFCRTNDVEPQHVLVVGDYDNDREMFACTGNGVLLAGDHNRHLYDSARWVVTSLQEVMDIMCQAGSGG